MSSKVILSLGSNIGNGRENILKALSGLESGGFRRCGMSSFYTTEPVGFEEQSDFVNAAVSGEFSGEPEELLEVIKRVESFMGRVRERRYGPRIIDIDIILFGDKRVSTSDLKIPHPEFVKRRFVLEPAAEIEPELKDPVTGKSIKELLDKCADSSEVKKETK